MQITKELGTRLQDNGDGGYTMHVFNSVEEAEWDKLDCMIGEGKYYPIQPHPDDQWTNDDRGWRDPVWPEERKALYNLEDYRSKIEDYDYDHGYLGSQNVTFEVDPKNGTIELVGHISFHGGQ